MALTLHFTQHLKALLATFITSTFLVATVEADHNRDKSGAPENMPCIRAVSVDDNYLDISYHYLNSWFCEPANWFDDFFADDRHYEEGHARTRVRWRNDVFFSENKSADFITTLDASMRLPKISKRLKLVFESDEQENLDDVIPTTTDGAQGSLGFLYDFLDSKKANLSLRLRFTPSITLRFRYTHPISDILIVRFTQNIFKEEGFTGENTRFDFDKSIDKKNVLRFSNQVEIRDNKDGFEWSSGLVLFHKIDEKSAFSYESSIDGETHPSTLATDYRLGVRYRRNFYRDWMFYELAPEVTWPREFIKDKRHSVAAFTVRLEILFERSR